MEPEFGGPVVPNNRLNGIRKLGTGEASRFA